MKNLQKLFISDKHSDALKSEIIENINTLKQSDKTNIVYGSTYHRYEINTVLTNDEVTAFEKKYNVELPEDYKWFLQNVGNGGAGAFHGLIQLDAEYLHCKLDAFTEFPFLVGEEFVIGNYDDEDKDVKWEIERDARCMSSSIYLCDDDYGYMVLVLRGLAKGSIWYFNLGECGGVASALFSPNTGLQMGFLEWYNIWLDRSLNELENPLEHWDYTDFLFKGYVDDTVENTYDSKL